MTRERTKRHGRMAAIVIGLLFAAISLRAMANPHLRRPVVQFIHFYEQAESSGARDMGVWDRIMYGLLMTETNS